MAQHGGYIPFSVLGRSNATNRKESTRRTTRRKQVVRRKRPNGGQSKRLYHILHRPRYAPGTMLRSDRQLYELSSDKQWIKI
jgi:hypothetical protein